MAYIKTLFKKFFNNIEEGEENSQIYPVTVADAVFYDKEKTIYAVLDEINKKLENISETSSTNYLRVEPFDDIVDSADISYEGILDTSGKIVWVKSINNFAYQCNGKYYNEWVGRGNKYYSQYDFRKPDTSCFYKKEETIYAIQNGVLTPISYLEIQSSTGGEGTTPNPEDTPPVVNPDMGNDNIQ